MENKEHIFNDAQLQCKCRQIPHNEWQSQVAKWEIFSIAIFFKIKWKKNPNFHSIHAIHTQLMKWIDENYLRISVNPLI